MSEATRHDDEIGGENRIEGVRNEGARLPPSQMFALCVYSGIMRVSRNYEDKEEEGIAENGGEWMEFLRMHDFSRIFDIRVEMFVKFKIFFIL